MWPSRGITTATSNSLEERQQHAKSLKNVPRIPYYQGLEEGPRGKIQSRLYGRNLGAENGGGLFPLGETQVASCRALQNFFTFFLNEDRSFRSLPAFCLSFCQTLCKLLTEKQQQMTLNLGLQLVF